MKQYYIISGDIDSLGRIEVKLKNHGIINSQIYVLSKDDTADGI